MSGENEPTSVKSSEELNAESSPTLKETPRKRVPFREKEFKVRNSLLTVYFEGADESDSPVAPIRNVFVAGFVLFAIYAVTVDLVYAKNPVNHLWLVLWNFERLPQTMLFWGGMALSSLLPYFVLKKWSEIPSDYVPLFTKVSFITVYVCYIFIFFVVALRFLFWMDLHVACSFIITCETTRILMKVHSFIRENVPRVLEIKSLTLHNDELKHEFEKLNNLQSKKVPEFPTLDRYWYFFFCPTFIYRDEYPRTRTRSYKKAAKYMAQAIFMILCCNLVHTQMVHAQFKPLNYARTSLGSILASIYPAIIPGMLCLLILFYGLLHCWLNAFAEVLQFGDRQYYADWWNSKSMSEYYRKWNLVVHEWLYAYIYRDVGLLIGGKRGTQISQIMVFFLSSIFHEYWFGVGLRIFYPIMFTLYFVFGGLFFIASRFIKKGYIWNTLMWGNLLIGTGMFVSFYAHEWYSRERCPPTVQNVYLDILVPRHWFCKSDSNFA